MIDAHQEYAANLADRLEAAIKYDLNVGVYPRKVFSGLPTDWEVILLALRTYAKGGEASPSFDQVRDAIVRRMGGHTISAQDGPAWKNFLSLLALVKAYECGLAPLPIREYVEETPK